MFCGNCGAELSQDSKFCRKCGAAVLLNNENLLNNKNLNQDSKKSNRPTVGGSFGYAIIIEIILQIIMAIAGEDMSFDFSIGLEIILWIIELVVITAIVHGFRRWRWDSKQ